MVYILSGSASLAASLLLASVTNACKQNSVNLSNIKITCGIEGSKSFLLLLILVSKIQAIKMVGEVCAQRANLIARRGS